ncbi:GNAT family N-acetyltransferase [Marinibaculum pumilum]|uniref:GNAT family N-acetyltransferase n=1 Tax=Marinibaculum pumilum TaxID=1766165 RepID=A0ABV7L5V0_9PROT
MTGVTATAGGLVVAGVGDASALAALHAAAFAAAARWPAAEIEALLRLETVTGLLDHSGPPAKGFVLFSQVAEEAEILTLAVDPAYRRQGLGLCLVAGATAVATSRGAARLLLEVGEGNAAARALYDRAGFRQVGRRPGYYTAGTQRDDALVLELRLPVAKD